MRTHQIFIIAGLAAVIAMPAHAQSVVKKTGDEIHHVLKKTGNGVKEAAGDVGSSTHHVLQKSGNATKTALGNATGIHKVGGTVGSAAQSVSRTGKHIARKTKHGVKKHASQAHNDLTKAGKDAKADLKKPN